jgi:hypothetical protein
MTAAATSAGPRQDGAGGGPRVQTPPPSATQSIPTTGSMRAQKAGSPATGTAPAARPARSRPAARLSRPAAKSRSRNRTARRGPVRGV